MVGNVTAVDKLASHIRNEFPQFWELPLRVDEIEYPKTGFDAVNSLLILDLLLNGEKSEGLALALPDDPFIRPLIIIESLVALFYYDLLVADGDYFKDMQVDDPAIYLEKSTDGWKRSRGVYLGTRPGSDGNLEYGIKVKSTYYWKPEKYKWKIKPLNSGSAKGLSRKGVGITSGTLEQSFGLEMGGAMAVQKSKLLFVTHNRSALREMLQEMNIGTDDFEDAFPMGAYTSSDKRYLLGRNPFGSDPLLSFASAVDVAADVAQADESHRLIIIDGRTKLRSAYGSIDRIKSRKDHPSLLCLLGPDDEEDLNALTERGIACWVWHRDDFKKWSDPPLLEADSSHPFVVHEQWMQHLSEREDSVTDVLLPEGAELVVTELMNKLRDISKELSVSPEGNRVASWCYRMLKDFLQLPLPIREYNAILHDLGRADAQLDARLLALHEKIFLGIGRTIPSHVSDPLKGMLKHFDELYSLFESSNPKKQPLIDVLSGVPDIPGTIVVCGNQEQALALAASEDVPKDITFIDPSRFPVEPIDRAVFTGWISNIFASKTMLSPVKEIRYLLYPCERHSIVKFERRRGASRYAISDKALRRRMFDGFMGNDADTKTDGGKPETPETDSLLETILVQLRNSAEQQSHQTGSSMKDAYVVAFENGSFTYLTEETRVDKLDRQSGGVHGCDVTEIGSHDELIFTDGSRRLFTEIIAGIEASPKYRQLAEKAACWWKVLKEYSDENRVDARRISELLAEKGCRRTPGTVQSWMEGHRIGPSEYRVIDAIADITGDSRLIDELDAVKSACHSIFSLRMKTGFMLIKRILNAAARIESDDLDEDVRKEIEDYARSARILTVVSISSEKIPVDARLIGAVSELP